MGVFQDFYKSLYSSDLDEGIESGEEFLGDYATPTLMPEQADVLSSPISREEIEAALMALLPVRRQVLIYYPWSFFAPLGMSYGRN